jgi:tetratricopeptide (TPR) repeat protein
MPSAPAAAAYLEQAETSEPQAAADPGNLYALSRLWQAARAGGDDAAAAGYEDNLRYFDLRAVAIPSDARLADYQARAMAELAEADVWTRETLLNVVSYQVWQFAGGEAGRRAEQVLNGLLARWPDDADLRFFKAELYHRRGDLKPAEAAYQAVLEADVAYTPAYLRLADMYEAVEVATDAEEIWARSADLWAEYRVAQPGDPLPLGRLSRLCARIGCAEDRWAEELNSYLQRCEPEYIASATIGEWTLMGYDVDEARLVRGEPVQLWLFWQPPAECTRAASIPPNVYQVAGRWVEVVDDAVNRVLNGGFELGVAYTSPTGFPDDLYHADPSTRRLVRERRLTDETTVAMLSNPEGVTHSSFMTKWMPVVEDRVYLLGAWVRSVEGKAAVNLQWHVPTEAPPFRDAYVGVAVEQTDWVHYVGVVDMPPGATAARVRLFNWGENARASFDNVVLVEMERPNRVSCGPKD